MLGDSKAIENGFLLRPDSPGLGITWNESIENKYPFDESKHEDGVKAPWLVIVIVLETHKLNGRYKKHEEYD